MRSIYKILKEGVEFDAGAATPEQGRDRLN